MSNYVNVTLDMQSKSLIVNNKQDGSELARIDISESSDFWAKTDRLIAAAPEMYKVIEELAYGTFDDCILVMVTARKLLAHIDGEEAEE